MLSGTEQEMLQVTRRQFLINTLAPLVVGKPALQALLNRPLVESRPYASDPAPPEEEPYGAGDGCPKCQGGGKLICPACDGTGRWTEASESAGLYQREAARHAGHCAWCDEWGEIMCPECEGMGTTGAGVD